MSAIVVGLDFGTSRSGLAWRSGLAGPTIYVQNWPGKGPVYPKTATAVLTAPGGLCQAWGWSAVDEYVRRIDAAHRPTFAGVRDPDEARRLDRKYAAALPCLHRNFKMKLRSGSWRGRDVVFQDQLGGSHDLGAIVTYYLRGMREHVEGMPGVSLAGSRWCLTVPALWSDLEKDFMRRAAAAAGLVPACAVEDVRIVLEPEAAATALLEEDQGIGRALTPGTRLTVIDAGGGTVDVTTHEVDGGGGLREVVAGWGEPLGSMRIDEALDDLIKDHAPGWGDFQSMQRADHHDFLLAWEAAKCSYRGGACAIDAGRLARSAPAMWAALQKAGLTIGPFVQLGQSTVERLFAGTLEKIAHGVASHVASVPRTAADHVAACVGGFGGSELLRRAVGGSLPPHVRLLVPRHPDRAVLQGAVLQAAADLRVSRTSVAAHAGAAPRGSIVSRRMRRTYGIQIVGRFDPLLDQASRRTVMDGHGGSFVRGRFHVLARIGEEFLIERSVEAPPFRPTTPDQATARIRFYASDSPHPRYVDDPGVSFLGDFVVALPESDDPRGPQILLSVRFGEAQISATASVPSGRETRCAIEYGE